MPGGLDTLVTQAQAARFLGVSRQLIHRWIELGHVRLVDGKVVYRQASEVEAKLRAKSGRPVGIA
jgi:predicted site-specific integrase-resolvase